MSINENNRAINIYIYFCIFCISAIQLVNKVVCVSAMNNV